MKAINDLRQLCEVYEWLSRNEPTLSDSNILCLPCVKQVQRNLNRPHFHPRWKPKCLVTKKCNIENCQALVYTNTSLASVDEIETFLQMGSQPMVLENQLLYVRSTMIACTYTCTLRLAIHVGPDQESQRYSIATALPQI